MTAPEETWTAPRLDELNERVNGGFEKADKKMEAGFKKADEKMEAGFKKADEKMEAGFREVRSEMKVGFERFDEKFDKLMWRMLAAAVSIMCALIGVIGMLLKAHGL